MNRPERLTLPMPDIQGEPDDRRIAIDQVGIKGLRYPLPFADRDVTATTIATCDVYVRLPEERKGTHMSRLVALFEARALPGAPAITVNNLRDILERLVVDLDAPGGRVELA